VNPQTVLILDDIPSTADLVSSLFGSCFASSGPVIERFADEVGFKRYLDNCDDQQTLLAINAAFKPDQHAYRYKLEGIRRIVKLAIRIKWLRRDAVLTYATIAVPELLQQETGEMFRCSPNHKYIDLAAARTAKLPDEIADLVECLSPIPNIQVLKEVIAGFCSSELIFHLGSQLHMLEKTYKLAWVEGRHEIADSLVQVSAVLPAGHCCLRAVQDTISLLSSNANQTTIEASLNLTVHDLRNAISTFCMKEQN